MWHIPLRALSPSSVSDHAPWDHTSTGSHVTEWGLPIWYVSQGAGLRKARWVVIRSAYRISPFSSSLISCDSMNKPQLPCIPYFYLEAAGQYDLCSVSVDLSPASENISVAGLVPWHYHRSPLNYSPNIKWILKWFYYLDHSKMYDWSIDWRRYRKSCWLCAQIRASVRIDVKNVQIKI